MVTSASWYTRLPLASVTSHCYRPVLDDFKWFNLAVLVNVMCVNVGIAPDQGPVPAYTVR